MTAMNNTHFQAAMDVAEAYAVSGGAPCAAAAVVSADGRKRVGAFGVTRPGGRKIDTSTLFDVASLTKVTATFPVMMRLHEQGKLTLSAPVSQFLPGFRREDLAGIRLFHLATHCSGLLWHKDFYRVCKSVQDAIDIIVNMELDYPTGSRVIYSDLGFILLGHIVQLVGGDTLDALAKKYVYDPLGMTNTGFRPKPSDNIAATEIDPDTGELICGVVHDENARSFGGVSGHAGLFSSIDDMSRYAAMLLNGGTLDGVRILSKQSIDVARVSHTPALDYNRGIAWQVNTIPACRREIGDISSGDLMSTEAFGHTGFTGTSLWVDMPNGICAVLMTNRVCPTRENQTLPPVRRLFHNAIFD